METKRKYMPDNRFEQLLEQHHLTFFWNEPNKIWWLRQAGTEKGNKRSSPAGARTREEAEIAALKLIQRQYR
jgi:hypothetical protein